MNSSSSGKQVASEHKMSKLTIGGLREGDSEKIPTVPNDEAIVFECVPHFQSSVESVTVNATSQNDVMTDDNISRTVSISCSSPGGEQVINTIEVSAGGDEMMGMEHDTYEEVEVIYTPDSFQYQVEAVNVGKSNKASNELDDNTDNGLKDVINNPRDSVLNHQGHLVLQQCGEPLNCQSDSCIVLEQVDKGQECSSRADSTSPGGGGNTSSLTVVNQIFSSDNGTLLQGVQGEGASFSAIGHGVAKSNDGKQARFDTYDLEQGTNKGTTKCNSLLQMRSPNSNVIFASHVQGLEQQIPVIIKTATLAQETIAAALTAQPLLISSSKTNPMTVPDGKTLIRSSGKLEISSNPMTVQVEVSEGTCVKMQKYFCQAGLCRICLVTRENLTSLFEDVSIDSHGMVENSRGPNASNKFHLLTAIKTLLDIEVEHNDGLPDGICMTCYDELTNFSVYRKRIAIGQAKLNQILEQVKDSNTPTFIPSLGEMDIEKTDIYKNTTSIVMANGLLKTSQYSHLVLRNLSDRLWDKIFSLLSSIVGYKSGKLKNLEHFTCEVPYVSGFFCSTCNSTIHGSKDAFAQHHYDFHGVISRDDVLYPCDICGNSYPLHDKSKSYAEHWLQHFFLHECTFCNKKLPSSKGLWVHKKSLHMHKEKKFACDEPDCEKVFHKRAHLNAHKRIHADASGDIQQTDKVLCITCNKRFSTPGSLAVHLATVHETERLWKCDVDGCQKAFKRKEILITHKESVHLNLRKYVCEICGEFFKSLSSKGVHMLKHKGEKQHNCSICSKQFFTSNALKSHMVKHQDVGHYECNECSKVFKRSSYLDEHKRTHTGEKPFICPICNRAIRMKSNYFKHMRIHKKRNEVQ